MSYATTTARTRKRCPQCGKMVEIGDTCVAVDGRHMVSKVNWFGRSYRRGAWHLWHPACIEERDRYHAESAARSAAELAAFRAEITTTLPPSP